MNRKRAGGILVGVLAMLALVASAIYVDAQNRQGRAAATAAQTIACINTAVAARAGLVESLDIDREGGRIVCEVEIIAENGREYNVYVDVVDNKIIRNVEDR